MTRNRHLMKDVFLISLTALVCLAGGIMTWLDNSPFPVVLTIPIAIAAYVFCEHLRWFRLGDLASNFFGIIALIFAAMEFLSEGQEAKLLSGAHLLCYLQWIILFQDKEDSWHWWSVVLSILQIAVCSVLTYNIWFGFWLIVYVILLIWTLAMFWMFMIESQFRSSESVSEDQYTVHASGAIVSQGTWNTSAQLPAVRGTELARPFSDLQIFPSSVTHAIQQDLLESWVSLRFLAGIAAMSLSAVVMGLIVFALIPRMWADIGIFGPEYSAAARGAMPGFTNRVQLNDVSANVDNPRTAFKVTMYEVDSDYDRRNRKELDIQKYSAELGLAEPLFRGAILGTYQNGTWQPTERESNNSDNEGFAQDPAVWNFFRNNPSATLQGEAGVLQEYELEPLETKTLFTMGAVRGAGAIPWSTPSGRRTRRPVEVNYDIVTHEIRYDSEHDPRGFRYFILSPRSPDIVSQPNRLQRIIPPLDSSMEISPDLHRLTTKAWEIVGREPDKERQSFNPRFRNRFRLSEDESRHRAEKLRNYLGDNPEYIYQLGAPVVDPALDPVEDFVFNRKAGHCEYFASALALMLRSVNIPSRVVTGFKGGISNEEDLSLTILQRHAHAWVEAYVGDRWVAYDPTPAAEEAVQSSSQISLWETARRLVSDTWNNYIINMRLEDQSSIATPVFELTRRQLNGGTLASFVSWVVMVVSTPRLWLTWQGGLLLLMIGFTILAIRFAFFLIKRIGTRLLVTFKKAESQRSSGVDFYEKFLAIMASRGLRPFPWQTQREFASVSLGQVPVTAERRKTLSDLISRLFYQVRFGGRSLSDSVKGDLQTELQSLESDLKTADRAPTEKAAK